MVCALFLICRHLKGISRSLPQGVLFVGSVQSAIFQPAGSEAQKENDATISSHNYYYCTVNKLISFSIDFPCSSVQSDLKLTLYTFLWYTIRFQSILFCFLFYNRKYLM